MLYQPEIVSLQAADTSTTADEEFWNNLVE